MQKKMYVRPIVHEKKKNLVIKTKEQAQKKL